MPTLTPVLKALYDKHIRKRKFTRDDMWQVLKKIKKRKYKKGDTVTVYDRMQRDYSYTLTNAPGRGFAIDFEPELTPAQMLVMGVFEGKYCNDCMLELPREWYSKGLTRISIIKDSSQLLDTLSPEAPNYKLNYYKIKSRLSLKQWIKNKWIPCTYTRAGIAVCKDRNIKPSEIIDPDIRGWFQWYCRYYLGRRLPIIDDIQIKRWSNFKRHVAQLRKHCKGKQNCRPRQRQAVLQWAYDPRLI